MIGHKLYYSARTGSTNDDAFRLGMEGFPEGTVIIADYQTKGRGRLARNWHSPPAANIYTSIILRPDLEPASVPQISLVAGVAVAELLGEYCPGRVELKWPNDVLVGGKKICGILAQMKMTAEMVDFVVVGIGINVNLAKDQFPSDLQDIATSVSLESGREISRGKLIINLYENLAKWYKKFSQNGFTAVKEKWLELSPMIGRDVQVLFLDEKITGRAVDLAEDGSLVIQTGENEMVKVSAGDATIIKKKNK